MATTIRNPIEWSADQIRAATSHVAAVGEHVGGEGVEGLPEVREIGLGDIRHALRKGVEDFAACRTDVMFLCLFYPLAGAVLAWMAFDRNLLPLVFPLISGFALIGPVAAVGLYEMSRRRERGEPAGWADAFAVLGSPSFGAIFVLGLALAAVLVVWLLVAQAIYTAFMGPDAALTPGAFIAEVAGTAREQAMALTGIAVGAVFALAVLVTSVVSFPLLLDRRVGLAAAVVTSVRVSLRNPVTIGTWGLVVAGGLVLGALPALLGLIFVMPILGHATWHLYRRAVAPAD
jgi:uncharacterized membrane protein